MHFLVKEFPLGEEVGIYDTALPSNKYLLLTEFEARTVSYESRAGHKSERKKRGSVTYSTDRENEASKIFIISLAFCMATKTKYRF